MNTDFFSNVMGAIDGETVFIVAFGTVFAGFIACLFISIFKSGYGLKKRAWFFLPVAFFCAFFRFRAETLNDADYSPLLMIFGVVLFIPLYFIRKKIKAKTDEKGVREFVRFIDGKIHDVANTGKESVEERQNEDILKVVPHAANDQPDLDFSHVKSVLERLEPATLSYTDRKQIHELEVALYSAERGAVQEDTKAKINEGLGNLLKIMAKHGV